MRYGFWQWADDNWLIALVTVIAVCGVAGRAVDGCDRPAPPGACADKVVWGTDECGPGQTIERAEGMGDGRYNYCRCPGSRSAPQKEQDGGAD